MKTNELPERLILPSHFRKYFENMAITTPEIGHSLEDSRLKKFFRSYEELDGVNVEGLVMVNFSLPHEYTGDDSGPVKIFGYQIEILKSVGNNVDKIEEALDITTVVLAKILRQISHDSDPTESVKSGVRLIEQYDFRETISDEINDPIMGGYVGVYAMVKLGNIISI
jgi:hypothetical protein